MDADAANRILVDIELPDFDPVAPHLIDLMSALEVVLVGWYAVPEQTSPAQARDQFGDEATAALDEVADAFRAVGVVVQTRLVFTGDELATIERISAEQHCDAVLIPRPSVSFERLLVPLRGLDNAAAIVHFAANLVQDGTTDVTLLHVPEEDEEHGQRDVLDTVAQMMADAGVDADLIQTRVEMADDPAAAIIEAAKRYDIVVIGETAPSIRDVIFGTVPEQIAHKAAVPVMVVRHRVAR